MSVYEVEIDGVIYEADAPTMEQAVAAAKKHSAASKPPASPQPDARHDTTSELLSEPGKFVNHAIRNIPSDATGIVKGTAGTLGTLARGASEIGQFIGGNARQAIGLSNTAPKEYPALRSLSGVPGIIANKAEAFLDHPIDTTTQFVHDKPLSAAMATGSAKGIVSRIRNGAPDALGKIVPKTPASVGMSGAADALHHPVSDLVADHIIGGRLGLSVLRRIMPKSQTVETLSTPTASVPIPKSRAYTYTPPENIGTGAAIYEWPIGPTTSTIDRNTPPPQEALTPQAPTPSQLSPVRAYTYDPPPGIGTGAAIYDWPEGGTRSVLGDRPPQSVPDVFVGQRPPSTVNAERSVLLESGKLVTPSKRKVLLPEEFSSRDQQYKLDVEGAHRTGMRSAAEGNPLKRALGLVKDGYSKKRAAELVGKTIDDQRQLLDELMKRR